ncbi:MAG: tetratricopeptide repeat protein [Pyrinomonadaceae bacterium]
MINRFLLTTFFVFILSAGFAGISFSQTGANATWRVQKYDLNVILPQDNTRGVTARAVLTLKNVSPGPAGTLTLRISTSAEIAAVKINDAVADFAKSEEKINSATSLQRIAVRFPSVAPEALLTASVEYKINLKENSALGGFSPNGAQFLPLSFWYPTPNSWFFTRGADMAPVRLKVAAAGGLSVVSSGAETSGLFEQKLNSQPFFVAGNWDAANLSGVTVYMPKGTGAEGQKRAAELAALMSEAKTFVGGILGNAPDVPLRLVSNRRSAGFGTGGTVIVDEGVFRRSRVDSLTAMNIAEAVAKIWLGNSVSITGDGNGVIAEGLSRYLATQFLESKYGKDVADIERLRQRTAYSAVSKRDAPMGSVSPLDDFYYAEVANKGAMVWRILEKRVGPSEFSNTLRSNLADGNLTLPELRSAFSSQKGLTDYFFDQVTNMNLLAGTPQSAGAETKVALRNTGAVDVTVDVVGTTDGGERLTASATIRATSFGEVSFKSPKKIIRVEIDSDKLYPQMEYSDDIAPRETTDSDPLLAAKRFFDKQDFANAESTARKLLAGLPRFDDLRILLGRALLSQGRNAEAEKEFRAVLDEKLPTARSIAWANVGLGEIAAKSNQNDAAIKFAGAAIAADSDYGASLAARNLRNKIGYSSPGDASVKTFFADFDKAATSNRKADVDSMVMSGEIAKFASGVAGSTEQWQTQIVQIDRLDENTILVEASMTVKLLTRNIETGTAVYRLNKVGNAWKLAGVDMFEVR